MTFIYSQEDQIADLIPSHEDSFERVEEEENMQFVSPCIGVEDEIILRELHENLYRALAKLNSNKKALLLARFHENKSQQDAAEELGISQQAVSRWEKEKRCGGRAKLHQAIEESRNLVITKDGDYTVESWCKQWFEVYSKPNLRPSTVHGYQNLPGTDQWAATW